MSNNSEKDDYGFDAINFMDNEIKKDYNSAVKFTQVNIWYIILILFIVFFIISSLIAGYYSWNEFPDGTRHIKILKSGLALLFPWAYLPYIFLKLIIFKK